MAQLYRCRQLLLISVAMETLYINKSSIAPCADRVATQQLNFLVLNMPFTVILNNYKSKLVSLDLLRILVSEHNGFAYHPNKNVKSRAFKGFSMALSPDTLNGLVVFLFFRDHHDAGGFLDSMKDKVNLETISYFSILIDGHISSLSTFSGAKLAVLREHISVSTFRLCNETLLGSTTKMYYHLLNKIYLILDAHAKSIN